MVDPARLREKLAEKTGARDTLLQQLRQEFGVETEADAQEYLELLDSKQKKCRLRIEELEGIVTAMMEKANGN